MSHESIIELPADFPISINAGLHGDMLFFEMSSHQMTTCEPTFAGDKVHFSYECHDSDEGGVTITYQTICGSDAGSPDAEGFDVEIMTGSDVWSLSDTASAVADAIALHIALGRDKPYSK